MTTMKRWRVEILVDEDEPCTFAEARLHTGFDDTLIGLGRAKLNPNDKDLPQIGDEIAVARALTELGRWLLITA